MTIKLIGSDKQIEWATDIIKCLEGIIPMYKQAFIEKLEEKVAASKLSEDKKAILLHDGLTFIDSLTNFPPFKNQAYLYIKYFAGINSPEHFYLKLHKVLFNSDLELKLSTRTRHALMNPFDEIRYSAERLK